MRVLVTGGTGTLGHAIIPKLLANGDYPVVLSRDEYKQSLMQKEHPKVKFILGDVRNPETVSDAVNQVGAVIHAAALKRIEIGEENPWEFVHTNVLGSKNVVSAVLERGVRASVLVSSDKAVYPINAYGTTKAMAEKLFLAAGLSVVRYGNVLGSRGSLLEIIHNCVEEDRPIPVTDPRMTRFFWSVDDAADFVIENLYTPGLHIPNLKGRRIIDLIEAVAPNHPTKTVGINRGEKLHEWLETVEENPEARPSCGGTPPWLPRDQEDPLMTQQVVEAQTASEALP